MKVIMAFGRYAGQTFNVVKKGDTHGARVNLRQLAWMPDSSWPETNYDVVFLDALEEPFDGYDPLQNTRDVFRYIKPNQPLHLIRISPTSQQFYTYIGPDQQVTGDWLLDLAQLAENVAPVYLHVSPKFNLMRARQLMETANLYLVQTAGPPFFTPLLL